METEAVPVSVEVYPRLSETAKKLGLSVQELVEWAVIDRFLYDMRFPAITRLYSGSFVSSLHLRTECFLL